VTQARRFPYRVLQRAFLAELVVGTPVVMISGCTHPTNEPATPHRVINYHACNSCGNNPARRFVARATRTRVGIRVHATLSIRLGENPTYAGVWEISETSYLIELARSQANVSALL
jgi:hypothetical protein